MITAIALDHAAATNKKAPILSHRQDISSTPDYDEGIPRMHCARQQEILHVAPFCGLRNMPELREAICGVKKMAGSTLAGTRVLLVEDEALVAMMLEDSLSDLGCLVASVASTLNEAEAKIVTVDFDLAILDVNLNGKQTDPIARALKGKDIPFVFCTGYGALSLPAEFGGAPVLAKPFQLQELQGVLTEVLRARG